MELLLLSQFNLDSPLPTFFELFAQQRLTSTMQDALRFLHAALANRFVSLAGTLPYNTEIFFTAWAFVERAFLTNFDSTFAENFFGMKRVRRVPTQPVAVPGPVPTPPSSALAEGLGTQQQQATAPTAATTPAAAAAPSGNGESATNGAANSTAATEEALRFQPLQSRDRWLGVLFAVLVPYINQRMADSYRQLRDTSADAVAARNAALRSHPSLRAYHWLLRYVYPTYNFTFELLTLVFWLLYVFERTPHYSFDLLLQGVVIRRATHKDMMLQQRTGSGRNILLYARIALTTLVIGFRFLEWWNRSDNRSAAVASLTQAEAPPPPPPEEAAKSEELRNKYHIQAGTCPVCNRTTANPAVCTVSGAVGCYPCLQQYVEQHGECPVTHVHCAVTQIRRLFDA